MISPAFDVSGKTAIVTGGEAELDKTVLAVYNQLPCFW